MVESGAQTGLGSCRAPLQEDWAAAATVVYVILRVGDSLKTLPRHMVQKPREWLGYDGPFGSTQGGLFGTEHVVEYQEETRQGGENSWRIVQVGV